MELSGQPPTSDMDDTTHILTETPPWAYELWEHMSHEHGLTLLESEMHEIILQCDRVRAKEYTKRAVAASERICCHLGRGMKEDPHVTRLVLSVVGMEFAKLSDRRADDQSV